MIGGKFAGCRCAMTLMVMIVRGSPAGEARTAKSPAIAIAKTARPMTAKRGKRSRPRLAGFAG